MFATMKEIIRKSLDMNKIHGAGLGLCCIIAKTITRIAPLLMKQKDSLEEKYTTVGKKRLLRGNLLKQINIRSTPLDLPTGFVRRW